MALCAYQQNATTWRVTQVAPESCPDDWRVLSKSEYADFVTLKSQVIQPVEPFDYVYAAGLWSLAFTFVVGLFLIARSAGTILNFIRARS